jgi:allantoicase
MTPSFVDLADLASDRLGTAVVAANDEFFAPKENLIKREAAVWIDGKYTERGKWMDGWETRRRRDAGDHDWCILRLGVPGVIRGVDSDTAFFKGNFPESCAIDACRVEGNPDALPGAAIASAGASATTGGLQADEPGPWRELLPRTRLQGDSHNFFAVTAAPIATHVRLRIFPDGGVARLRLYGEVAADWDRLRRRGDVDLAAVEHGGLVVACSDMFFGSPHNLIMPGDATHMGDGWETKRRRGPGHDWVVVRLGTAGAVRRIEVDTRHFKGNAPAACRLEGARADELDVDRALDLQPTSDPSEPRGSPDDQPVWQELLPRTPLQPHWRHTFEDEVRAIGNVTHVRLNIYPDGGVGRLRLFGSPA